MAIEDTTRALATAGLNYTSLLEQKTYETGDPSISERESLFGYTTPLKVDSAEYIELKSEKLYRDPEVDRSTLDRSHEDMIEELSKMRLPSRLGDPTQLLKSQFGAVVGLKQALDNYLAKVEELERLAEEGTRRSNPTGITAGIESLEKELSELEKLVTQERRDLRSSGLALTTGVAASLDRMCDSARRYNASLAPSIRAVRSIEDLSESPISTSLPEIPGRRHYLEANLKSLTEFLESSSSRKGEFTTAAKEAYEERGAEGIAEVLRTYKGIVIADGLSEREVEDMARSLDVALGIHYDRDEGIELKDRDGKTYGAEAGFGSSLIGAIDLTSAEITKRREQIANARKVYGEDVEFRLKDRNSGNPRPTTDQDFIEATKRREISRAQRSIDSTRYAKRGVESLSKSLFGTTLSNGRIIDGGEYGRFLGGTIRPIEEARDAAAKEGKPFFTIEDPEAEKAIACASQYAKMLDSWRNRINANQRALELHQIALTSGVNNEGHIPDIGDPPLESLEAARAGLKDFERIPAFSDIIERCEEAQRVLVTAHRVSQTTAQKALEEEHIRKEIAATPEPVTTLAGRFSSLAGNLRLGFGRAFFAIGAPGVAKGFLDAAAKSGKASGSKALVEASLRGSFKAAVALVKPKDPRGPKEFDPQRARDAMAALSAQEEADRREMEATRTREASLETALTPRRSVVATAIRENLEAAGAAGLDMSKIAPASKNRAMDGYQTLFRRDSDAHFLRFNSETGDVKLFKKGTVRSSTEVPDIFDENGVLKEEHRELVKGLISGQTSRMQESLKEAETTRETTRVETIAKEEIERKEPVAAATIKSETARIFEEFKKDENFSKLRNTGRRDGNHQLDPVTIAGKTYTIVLNPDSSNFRLFEGKTEIPVKDQSALATFEAVTKQSLGSVRGKDYALKHMDEIATKATAYSLEDHPEIQLYDSKRRGFAGWKDFGKTEGSTHYARFKTNPETGKITEVKLFDRTQGRTAIEVPAFDTYGSPTKEFSQFLDRVSAPIQEIDERERVAEQARLAEAARVEAEAEAARVEADRAHRAAREAEAAARVAAENQKESMAEYRSTINSKFMPYLDNYEAYFKEDSKFGDPERPFCREADPDHYIAVTKDFRSPTSPPFKLYTQDGAEVEMFGPDGNIKPEVQEIVDALFEKYPAFIATKQEKVKAASAEKDKENLQRVEEHFGSKIEDARRLAGHFYGDDLDQEERDGVLVEEIEEKETPDVLEFLEVREAAIAKARETLNEEQIAAATAQGFEIYDDEGALNEEDILAFVGKEIIAQEKGEEVETPTLDALSAQKAAEATRESDDRKMAQAMAKEVLEEAEAGIAETKTRHLTDDVVHDPEVAAVIAALRGKELQTETQDSVVGRLQRTESRDTLPIAEEALEDGSVKDVLDAISTGTAEVPTGYADSKVALLASPTRDNLNSALSEMVGGGDSLAWGVKDFRTQAEAIGAKIDGNKVTMPAVTVPGAKGPIRFVLVLDDDGKVSETELHGGAKTMFGGEKKRDLAVGDQVKPKHVSEVDSLVSAYEKMLGVETITKESSHSSFVDMVDRGKESHHGPTFAGRSGKEGMVR